MANLTSNSLFIASALVFVVGLLFLAFPFLTLVLVTLCAIGHTYHSHSAVFVRYYAQFSTALWPPIPESGGGSDRQPSYASTLLRGVDLPSPIPYVHGGLETTKNRRSPVDEIVSSTPRSTPTSIYGSGASMPLPIRSSPAVLTSDSHQLNFGRINTPKSSRFSQETHQSHLESNMNVKQRSRAGSSKTVQTTAGPLLPSGRYNPSFDAGIFVNVNSPGFTDRLVRCASDTSLSWSQTNLVTQQDRYNSVGLFPIVHLNTAATSSLSPKNSLKAPQSNVRVRIAPPAYSEQRKLYSRGVGPPMKSYVPTTEVIRRNDVTKSVLESLQEASRKRIYSQCQEVLEDDSGRKRQKKGDPALPNPNCDMYQYRHIRAPPVPSTPPMMLQNDTHYQGKRIHDDPLSRANEPKRQRQQGKTFPINNEITSSLSSSKTLLQRLSGNKRKADDDFIEDVNGKHFKESVTSAEVALSSRWLHTRPCDEGESSARTQEVVRSQRRSTTDGSSPSGRYEQRKVLPSNNRDQSNIAIINNKSNDSVKANLQNQIELPQTDLASRLFRKDVVTRPHPKTNISEKKGSTWTQVPPDADERCLLAQNDSSELDRPERFQSLLSRMCGQDYMGVKNAETFVPVTISNNVKSISKTVLSDSEKEESNKTLIVSSSRAPMSSLVSVVSLPTSNVGSTEAVSKPQPSPLIAPSLSPASTSSPSSPVTVAPMSLVTNDSSNTSQLFSSYAGLTEKANLLERQDKSDSQPSCTGTTSLDLPASKPMFSFSPPSPLAISQSILTAVSSTSSSTSTTSISNPVSFSPSMFKFTSSASKSVSDSVVKPTSSALPQSMISVSPNPSTAPSQGKEVTFLTAQSQAAAASNANSGISSPIHSTDFVSKFSLPGQNLQFPSSLGSVSHPQTGSHLNGPKPAIALTSCPSSFQVTSPPIQPLAAEASFNMEGKKNSLGDLIFSGSPFGQTNSNSTTATPSLSYPSVTSSSMSGSVESDSKSASGSGSITFGTVSATVTQPSKPLAFTFSAPTQTISKCENPEAPMQFGGNTLTGFNNSSQVVFNGLCSATDSTTSAAPSFGASSPHQQGTGGFSFGNPTNQPASRVTFDAGASTPMFGDRAPQQSNYNATTTAGFSLQSTGPAFSNSPFGSFNSSSVAFGSQQPTSSPFGGQAATSNPPSFGPSPSNPVSLFGNNSTPPVTLSFGAPSQHPFGVSPLADTSFGTNPPAAPSASINNSFSFGADKPPAPAFNFGANNVTSGSTFSFGSTEQPLANSGNSPFQFGQVASPSSAPPFQFGSPSAQAPVFNFGGTTPSFGAATNPAPIGNFTIGGFSMGSGPTTPQRARALQTRRRRT